MTSMSTLSGCCPGPTYCTLRTGTEQASLEGMLVDPVYTGKAFGGLIDLVRSGVIGRSERVLFWHTGGQPAIFAYADQLG